MQTCRLCCGAADVCKAGEAVEGGKEDGGGGKEDLGGGKKDGGAGWEGREGKIKIDEDEYGRVVGEEMQC